MVWALFALSHQFGTLQIEEAGLLGLLLSGFAVWRFGHRQPYGVLSCATIYIGSLCAFHFGLIGSLGLGFERTAHIEEATWYWLYSDYALEAARLSLAGAAGCAFGLTLAQLFPLRWAPRLPSNEQADRALGTLGSVLVVLCVAAWLGIVVSRGGLGVFLGSYANMLEATKGTRLPTVQLFLNISVPLMAATTYRPIHRYAVAACIAFAVLGFPMGLRGEVLFPLAGAAVVQARRGFRISFGRVALLAAIVLAATAVVRDIRSVGIGNVESAGEVEMNPLIGLMELGGTLRPVHEVVRWYDEGDDFIWGASYWATIDRPIRRIVPWIERIPAEDDERIMNVLVLNRNVGAIGFSPIAEGYRNFGPFGSVLVMVLTGFLIGRLDQVPATPTWTALVGVIFIPALNQVRNSFIALPFSTAVGVVLVLAITAFYGTSSRPSAAVGAPQA